VNCHAELLLGVSAQVLLDESRSETVKTGGDRGVRSKEVACPSDCQCHFEGLTTFFHEASRAFQNCEGGMPLIQVTDFRLNAECAEQPPSADPEEQFLLKAQLRPSAIQLARDRAVYRIVGRIVAVKEVELHSAHLHLPHPQGP